MSVFDSREEACKTPYGAVPCGTEVTFTLRPAPQEGFSACSLLVWDEFRFARCEVSLSPCAEGFRGTYTAPPDGTLLWYLFRFTRPDGSARLYGRGGYDDSARFQLTVYRMPYPTPQWFGRGVTYQIFPDRFCRLGLPDPSGMPGTRTVHQNWSDTPDYQPDCYGTVRNCDFFGGSLAGILSRLDYLQSLSVTTLYLNPIFTSVSNHRYDTADYMAIDPMLGTESDFRQLCAAAKKRGIRIMLDGVFNHTGSDSRYFNARGTFEDMGAAQSKDSPYYPWYRFGRWPDEYDAWWGVETLPAVNEDDPTYRRFIITDEDSVVRHWLRCGASAWRLDVADELPDDFIAQLRQVMAQENPDSFLLGEVWEDASNKIAYEQRRRYFLDGALCGVMNYPFRGAALHWLRGGDASDFREEMETLREHYPHDAYYSGLNILGTHDTARVLTVLGAETVPERKEDRAAYRLSAQELAAGLARLRLGAMLQYCFPGSPTVFYGDEAGMQGFEDPLNRGAFPWGGENRALLSLYRQLGQLRQRRTSLQWGTIRYLHADGGLLVFQRSDGGETTICALNAGHTERELRLPWLGATAADLLSGQCFLADQGQVSLTLPPLDGVILG